MKKYTDYLFESITEYDIDETKHYDMKFGGAKQLILYGYDGEKIRIRLASNTLPTIQSDFKVKIDDIKKRIDVEVSRKNGVTEALAKENVNIFVQIPNRYIGNIECAINSETVELHSLECENIEFDVKVANMVFENVIGTVEINCNLDMNIICKTLNGSIEINQVSSTSRICIPEGVLFSVVTKGVENSISYEKKGKVVDSFAINEADNVIELNGIKSELVIYTSDEKA